ncbi:MAG: beta-lactamase family protein [Anaerolineae bacterium]|nr:beta-lactamase family protein [Anaerolineae bacterium]
MADVNARVQTVMEDLIARGVERGLQVAAYLNGELVVDAWAGLADAATGRPVDGDTLFTVFSTTKGITATVIHLLADRGLLDYDTPIAEYWPEFGAHGKERITVRQALTHTAGIPQMPDNVLNGDVSDWEWMCQDWDWMCRAIADLTPLWEPGTATGYHGATFGWILGEVARRVDGRPIAQIVQDEICRPLGITSLYLSIPDAVEPRVASLKNGPSSLPPPPPDALVWRVIPGLEHIDEVFNRTAFRHAVMPASSGIMNARALARHYAALACGELDGVRLLTPERIRIATTLQTEEVDLVLGVPGRKALGYWLGEPLSPMAERLTAFGHTGLGGSVGFADPEYRFVFGLTKNSLVGSLPGEDAAYLIAREVRAALGIPEAG